MIHHHSASSSPTESADLEEFLSKNIDIEDDSSCRFFITGFAGRHTKMIQTIIRAGGRSADAIHNPPAVLETK